MTARPTVFFCKAGEDRRLNRVDEADDTGVHLPPGADRVSGAHECEGGNLSIGDGALVFIQ